MNDDSITQKYIKYRSRLHANYKAVVTATKQQRDHALVKCKTPKEAYETSQYYLDKVFDLERQYAKDVYNSHMDEFQEKKWQSESEAAE